MAGDDRTYVKLHDGMPHHPKVRGLSDRAFRCYITAMCYCSEYLTDGEVVAAVAKDFGSEKIWRELCDAGLIDRTQHGYAVHDYLQHQRSAAEVADLKEKRRSAGRKGGQARSKPTSNDEATTQASAKQVLKQTGSKTEPETETESLSYERDGGAAPKRASQAPTTFLVDDALRSWAAAKGVTVNLDRETEKFLDWHRAKGSTFKDWRAAWRTWMGRIAERTPQVDGHSNGYVSPSKRLPAAWR